jgi:hypothetical protein
MGNTLCCPTCGICYPADSGIMCEGCGSLLVDYGDDDGPGDKDEIDLEE